MTHSKSIAVLPFVNTSPGQENDYLCDGITEEIIHALAKIEQLKVTSRTSSFFFKGKNRPVAEIGRELDVANLLEGSLRVSRDRLRITAQLIKVSGFAPRELAWNKAMESLQRASEIDPQNTGLNYLLANQSFFTGKPA